MRTGLRGRSKLRGRKCRKLLDSCVRYTAKAANKHWHWRDYATSFTSRHWFGRSCIRRRTRSAKRQRCSAANERPTAGRGYCGREHRCGADSRPCAFSLARSFRGTWPGNARRGVSCRVHCDAVCPGGRSTGWRQRDILPEGAVVCRAYHRGQDKVCVRDHKRPID